MHDAGERDPSRKLTGILLGISGPVLIHEPTRRLFTLLELRQGGLPGGTVLLSFEEPARALAFKRALARDRFRGFQVLVSAVPWLAPVRRRTLGGVVTPLPFADGRERPRYLRKMGGLLREGGLLVVHARVRGQAGGLTEHAARVVLGEGVGLLDEAGLCGLVLRSGFAMIEARRAGMLLRRRTLVVARKATI